MSRTHILNISVRDLTSATVVDLDGAIDLQNSRGLRTTLFEKLLASPRLVVNMRGIRYIDSSGIARRSYSHSRYFLHHVFHWCDHGAPGRVRTATVRSDTSRRRYRRDFSHARARSARNRDRRDWPLRLRICRGDWHHESDRGA